MIDMMIIKKIIASILYYSGIINIISKNYNESVILCYHHVFPRKNELLDFIEPGMYTTVESFEKHLQFLSKKYNIISLEKVSDLSIKNACIITFDDGWADNYTYAYPILKKYELPATIFLTTNLIGTADWPWPDRISYYIHFSSSVNLKEILKLLSQKNIFIKKGSSCRNEIGTKDRFSLADQIISSLKRLPHDEICTLMEQLDNLVHQLNEYIRSKRPWLSWEEIREMQENNISFGSHTHNHVILTNTSVSMARDEILFSKQELANKLGKPVTMFSFPSSYYNESIIDILKSLSFRIGVTTQSQSMNESESILTLKRFYIHEDTTDTIPMLACLISGVFTNESSKVIRFFSKHFKRKKV